MKEKKKEGKRKKNSKIEVSEGLKDEEEKGN